MIALLQRVLDASVTVAGERVAEIGTGILVFVAAVPDDTPARAARLAERVAGYRLFADANGRMNDSVVSAGHRALAVPQFTLAADTRRGNRPGFSTACPPATAEPLFGAFVAALRQHDVPVVCGIFGADMQVALVNDGPVTFWLDA